MLMGLMQPIIDFIVVSWKSIGSFLLGALITTYISYKFTKWRENERIRIDLRVKTADQLIDVVKTFNNASSKVRTTGFTFLKSYNTVVKNFPILEVVIGDPTNQYDTTRMLNEIRREQIEQAKENIRNNYNEIIEAWGTYCDTFFPIINILETKEVILHRFKGIRYLLLDEFTELMKLHKEFTEIYFNEICESLTYSKPIYETTVQRVDDVRQKFWEKCMDKGCIIWDLQVGLQNEFLSKLFNYKVPLREPKDKTKPVYKPGFKYEMADYESTQV